VNLGVGVGQNKSGTATPSANAFTLFNLTPSGAAGGGQIGYNRQLGNWLIGAEADIQGIATSQSDAPLCLLNCRLTGQSLPWFGTVRGRFGYASGPVLSYVTGGFAYGDVKTGETIIFNGSASSFTAQHMTSGWTLGSGVEAALGGNWTGKLEYLYLDLGNTSESFILSGANRTFNSDVREHIFRAGVNYRVGGTNVIPAASPVAKWAGFYLGGNAGSGVARDHFQQTIAAPFSITESFSEQPRGFIGGAQAGYNWQAANWVFGIEADFQGTTQRDDRTCLVNCALTGLQYDQKLPWFGTVRSRLGYGIGQTLFYATGGLAYGEVKTTISDNFGGVNVATLEQTKTGWAAGAGIESPLEFLDMFGKNWTAKTEYLYVDLGSSSNTYSGITSPLLIAFVGGNAAHTFSTHVTDHVFRTGLNYHFNSW
jgi:outer membrane immunogenic protein